MTLLQAQMQTSVPSWRTMRFLHNLIEAILDLLRYPHMAHKLFRTITLNQCKYPVTKPCISWLARLQEGFEAILLIQPPNASTARGSSWCVLPCTFRCIDSDGPSRVREHLPLLVTCVSAMICNRSGKPELLAAAHRSLPRDIAAD